MRKDDMTIIVIGGGISSVRGALVAAMVTLNMHIISTPATLEVKLRPQEASLRLDSMWPEMAFKESTQNTYGPSKKGRGGKIKRW